MRALSRYLAFCWAVVLTAGTVLTVATSTASAAPTCDTSWAHPGTSGGWNTAGDWTNGVPTADKVACLGASTTPYQVIALGGTNAAKGVVIGSFATVVLEGEEEDLDVALSVGTSGITNAGTIEMTSVNSPQNATLTVASGAKLINSGTVQADAGAGGNRFLNAAVVNTGYINANTNVVMNSPLTNKHLNSNGSTGTVAVAANQLMYVPALTNYAAQTHTLNGGVYNLEGTLAVPGLDVQTLNATVNLLTATAELQNAPHTNAFVHLAALTQSFTSQLTLTGSLTVGPLSVGGQLVLAPSAKLTSTAAVTTVVDGLINIQGGTLKTAKPLVNHGAVFGSGTINGSVQNSGFFVPQSAQAFGLLTVTGNFSQTKVGAFGEQWDQTFSTTPLQVNGTATLAGTLFLSASNTAGNGATLPLISAGKRTGTFGETSFLVFTDGTRPLPVYSGNNVSITATATLQQDDLRVGYQGWSGVPSINGDGTYTRDSNTPGDALSYTFTGTQVGVVLTKGPNLGKAQITLDGASKGIVDTYQATSGGLITKTLSGLKNAKHTVTVSVTGTKNAQSSDSIISVIGFRDAILQHDPAAPGVNIPGWTKTTSAAASFGSYVSATAAGKTVTVPFSGTGIDWVAQTCPSCGKARVVVDHGAPTTVDLYSATTLNQVAEPFRNLAAGSHTITITVLGTKRGASTGTTVVVDDFVVHP